MSQQTFFDLAPVPYQSLKNIIKKLPVHAGFKFMRTCKEAQKLTNLAKPAWRLTFQECDFELVRNGHEYCSFNYIIVHNTTRKNLNFSTHTDDHTRANLLAKLEKITSVKTIAFRSFADENPFTRNYIEEVVAIGKPLSVEINMDVYDSSMLQQVKHLGIVHDTASSAGDCYLQSWDIYTCMTNRRTLWYWQANFDREGVKKFIKKWLKGASTSTLATLTYRTRMDGIQMDTIMEIMMDETIQRLVSSYDLTDTCLTLQREDDSCQLRISAGVDQDSQFDWDFESAVTFNFLPQYGPEQPYSDLSTTFDTWKPCHANMTFR